MVFQVALLLYLLWLGPQKFDVTFDRFPPSLTGAPLQSLFRLFNYVHYTFQMVIYFIHICYDCPILY